MVKVSYPGWGYGLDRAATARERLRELAELRQRVQRMGAPFFPLGEDWVAINAINEAMDRAVRHFGLDPIDVWRVNGAVPDPNNALTKALNDRE